MTRRWRVGAGLAAIALIAAGPPARATDPPPDDEQQIGQEVFNELKAKGEIIGASPLYGALTPVTAPIVKTAQPRYNHPFKFYLVHEPQPNAFSVPGGNVYVTDALLYFVRNTEELAGTLCHEVSHTIHHDSMALIEKEQQIARRELGAAILLGDIVAAAATRAAQAAPAAVEDVGCLLMVPVLAIFFLENRTAFLDNAVDLFARRGDR